MKSPLIDLVIAAHDPERRVDRAVSSVLEASPSADIRVTLVVHGIPVANFDDVLGSLVEDPRLRVVELIDGIRSPAGPFNLGLTMATAEYVGVMGSDDFLEPGTIDAWAEHVREHRSDFMMTALRDQNGALWREPLSRPRRRVNLDPVRDRLNYRTAPLGLIRREFLDRLGIEFTPGVPTGEDIELGLAVLNRGSVSSAIGLPAYVIGHDAPQRVTFEKRTFSQEISPLLRLTSLTWLRKLPVAQRNAIGIKIWRMSVLTGVCKRRDRNEWSDDDLAALAQLAQWLHEFAPGATKSLARAELPVVEAATSLRADSILDAIDGFFKAGKLQWVLTGNPLDSLRTDTRVRRILRLRLPA